MLGSVIARSLYNIPPRVLQMTERKLLSNPDHPLSILKNLVYSHASEAYPGVFTLRDDFDPKVTARQNFDYLLTPKDHVSRRPTDTYYFDENRLLRTHTSAHQVEMMKKHDAFLVAGDVYRRDTIDRTHYPAFHQMEGVRLWSLDDIQASTYEEGVEYALKDLKFILESISRGVYGEDIEMRWVDAYFPFTHPSLELEILYNGSWLEVLGCGVIQPGVLKFAGKGEDTFGWAFGLGLERWAMKLFDIPDIRLFWSNDKRFKSQFSASQGITKFQEFSKYPLCKKDVSFWLGDNFQESDFFELVRGVGGDLIEEVIKVDEYQRGDQVSRCYRVHYRSMDRVLTNQEIDRLQFSLRDQLESTMNLELR